MSAPVPLTDKLAFLRWLQQIQTSTILLNRPLEVVLPIPYEKEPQK